MNYSLFEGQPYTVLALEPPRVEDLSSEWQIKLDSAYRFAHQLDLGVALRYQQGHPYVLFSFGEQDPGPPFPFMTLFFVEPFGTRTVDNLFTLDFKVTKGF